MPQRPFSSPRDLSRRPGLAGGWQNLAGSGFLRREGFHSSLGHESPGNRLQAVAGFHGLYCLTSGPATSVRNPMDWTNAGSRRDPPSHGSGIPS